jgi:hypothetical protein
MKKLLVVLLATSIAVPAQAWYPAPVVIVPPPPPPPPPSTYVAGHASPSLAWGAGSILGIAAFLSGYDIARRWFCIGDPLRLGGPGFSTPMPAHGNVKPPPVCGVAKKRKVISVKG